MAKTQKSGSLSVAIWLIVIVAIALAAAFYAFRQPISGYADVGTSYAARVACSCRFVAGRPLGDCEKDKLGGMELVTLVEDADAKSVTARFPLVTANTASYREGFGCVLDEWED
ncbi:MAG: hypothetical protein AAGL10_14180 [Pseudomonadota bacterium]